MVVSFPRLSTLFFIAYVRVIKSSSSSARMLSASIEDYDASILDTYTLYGSPYGGFGRATGSKIGALPLRLPNVRSNDADGNPLYLKMRDEFGVLHSCRVYHENELDPSSLEDSMFDPPKLRSGESSADTREVQEEDVEDEIALLMERDFTRKLTQDEIDLLEDETMDRLEDLEGVCGQVHKGWWSYEWCYEHGVSQFHVAVETETNAVGVEDMTKLGMFENLEIIVDLANHPPNEEAEDVPELSRVNFVHGGGDVCDETGQPRRTFVELKCCSPRVMERQPALLHRNLAPLTTKIASVVDIYEDEEAICNYNITVCTPLLCGLKPESKEQTYVDENGVSTETVRGLLDRVLGEDCLPSSSGGWWTYEVCHRGRISQYHEEMGYIVNTETNTRVPKKVIDDQYNLGEFDENTFDSFPSEEEHLHVVNATSSSKTGTYFEVEYRGGDRCDDDKDVKDAAVVAGSKGSTGIQRASTVRYFCGPETKVTVNEDRTCHYMVRVFVPELCLHPLFKAPVTKKQVIKCLPVTDEVR